MYNIYYFDELSIICIFSINRCHFLGLCANDKCQFYDILSTDDPMLFESLHTCVWSGVSFSLFVPYENLQFYDGLVPAISEYPALF